MPLKSKKDTLKKQKRPTIFKWFRLSLVWVLLAKLAAKHQKHARRLAWLLVVMGLVCGAWFAYQYWQMQQIKSAQYTLDSQFKGLKIESKSYTGEKFHGYAAYIISENETLNSKIASSVDAFFIPCKEVGERSNAATPHECNANFTIDFATPDYLQLTYIFREHGAQNNEAAKAFLFDRKSGNQLDIKSLFKKDSDYLPSLASAAKTALQERFKDRYKTDEALGKQIDSLTTPKEENFANFALSTDEKIILIYNSLSAYTDVSEPVVVALPSDSYFDMLNDRTVDTFFPKIKEQKEAARRLAEEAKRKAEEAEAARRAVRGQVAGNRANIDCGAMKCVALTFDDGPHPVYTNQLLDMLQSKQAVATFFVLGSKVAGNTDTIRRAVSLGNEIANHSWSHAQLTNLSDQGILDEVQRTDLAVYNATGSYPKLLRPPYGATDGRVQSLAGMPIALWSVDTQDWLNRNSQVTFQRALAGTRPGATILMHDIHGTSVAAATWLVDELQRQGYIFVTMSELFGIGPGNIQGYAGSILRGR